MFWHGNVMNNRNVFADTRRNLKSLTEGSLLVASRCPDLEKDGRTRAELPMLDQPMCFHECSAKSRQAS
eukprot:1077420-Amphidinium_carterae.1